MSLEVVLEDQMLDVVSTQETTPDMLQSKPLLKKEQHLIARLQEVQDAETRAQDRFQRAKRRLKRRRERLDRILGKLALVRKQIADLQITDQQFISIQPTFVITATPESTIHVDSEEITLVQPEHETEVEATSDSTTNTIVDHESASLSLTDAESTMPGTNVSEQETTSISADASDVSGSDSDEEEQIEQELVANTDSAAVESEVDDSSEVGISTHSNLERKPTSPLRLEEDDQPAARALSPDIQSTKETWVAAESAMQHARNAAHGIAASISFLSQTNGLSNEFMEELVRKQADANKALLKAQDAARTAYERFVQAQKDAEYIASQPSDASTNPLEHNQQQNQDHSALPPAEDNGVDQTAKLHAIRLYKEW